MAASRDVRATGDRIERLLEELGAAADPRSLALSEELLRSVAELYGAGLERIVELTARGQPSLVEEFAKDELVASLLIVHGLHPESLAARVDTALAKVRPLLGAHGGDVELLGLDAEAGAVQLRLLGSCEGCPSSSVTLKMAVERSITEAAPEISRIDVEEPPPVLGVPIALRVKPSYAECPVEVAST
jgi:Fe-S cluster biogenesis protein NfuA